MAHLTSPCGLLLCLASCVALGHAGGAGSAKDLSQGGIILMFGDSILDCHEGDKRIDSVMRRLLEARAPHAHWTIYNEAHGGEYIGPREGTPVGVSEPLFTTESTGRFFGIVERHPHADAVVINYAANDGKVYPPAAFRKRLETLTRLLEEKYPGAMLIISTSMYLDPKHSAPYHYEYPQIQSFSDGDSRNNYLEPYNREIRELAAARRYHLADTYQRVAAEAQKGNWDLRIRADEGDPKDDPKHQGDMAWFDNIHPNDSGTNVIAVGLVEALTTSPR